MNLLASLNPGLREFARAIVLANKDPDNLGRVRLEYPWLGASSAKLPSEWARLCLPYASKDSGLLALPEIGDEVLVFFDNGNMEAPIVMGVLYNERNRPPRADRDGDQNSRDENNLKFIRSRTGHLLCFDDSSSKGALVIRERSGRRVELNSDESIRIQDDDGNQIEMKGEELRIQNKAGSKITLKGGKISIEASGSIELGAGASQALVKGQSFMQLFNSHTHTVGPATSTPPNAPMTPAQLSQKVKTA